MSKPLSITVYPSPLKGEYLTVSDAMKQVLDLVDAVEKAETVDGGERQLVWRLKEAHTNSPPFTVVAEAFPAQPSLSVSLEANRVSQMFMAGVRTLLSGDVPEWVDAEVGRSLRRALERNLNGVSRTVIEYGDDEQLSIAPQTARSGIAALDRLEIEAEATRVDWSRTEYGSVEGEVCGLTRWNNRPALLMIERLSGERFTCVLDQDLADRVGPDHRWIEAWDGRRLLVTGELYFNAAGSLKRAEIYELEEKPWTEVKISDLRGINIIDDRSVKEHVKKLRGDGDA